MVKLIIDTEEKYRRKNNKRNPRNEKGLTPKQQELADLKLKIQSLKNKGDTQSQVSEELNKPLRTIQRYWKG